PTDKEARGAPTANIPDAVKGRGRRLTGCKAFIKRSRDERKPATAESRRGDRDGVSAALCDRVGLSEAGGRPGKRPQRHEDDGERGAPTHASQHITAALPGVQLNQAVECEAFLVDQVVKPGQRATDRRDLLRGRYIYRVSARVALAPHDPLQDMRGE